MKRRSFLSLLAAIPLAPLAPKKGASLEKSPRIQQLCDAAKASSFPDPVRAAWGGDRHQRLVSQGVFSIPKELVIYQKDIEECRARLSNDFLEALQRD